MNVFKMRLHFLNQYFENASNKEMPESQFKHEQESLGCCPWCNQPVYAFKSAKGLLFYAQ